MKKRYSFLSPLLAILLTTCGPKVEPTYLTYELLINNKKEEKKYEQEDYYKVHFTDKLTIKASATGPKAAEVKWKIFLMDVKAIELLEKYPEMKIFGQANDLKSKMGKEYAINATLEFTFKNLGISEKDFKKLTNDTSVIIQLGFGTLSNKKEVSNARNEGNFKFKIDWTPKPSDNPSE